MGSACSLLHTDLAELPGVLAYIEAVGEDCRVVVVGFVEVAAAVDAEALVVADP